MSFLNENDKDNLHIALVAVPIASAWIWAIWILLIEVVTAFCTLWWYARFFAGLLGVK